MYEIKFGLLCCLALVLASCDPTPTPATIEQKKAAMIHAKFRQDIFDRMPQYEKLYLFLQEKADSIIEYRSNLDSITVIRGPGLRDTTYLSHSDCYTFIEMINNAGIEKVPVSIKDKLNKIYRTIGAVNIKQFTICRNKKIEITAKIVDDKNGLSHMHILIWNMPSNESNYYLESRDTAIDRNCIYRIGLVENHGW